jgi:hypothetical protein
VTDGSTRRTLGIVGMAVGGAGLVAGAVTGGLAVSKHGFLTTNCPQGQCNGSVKQGDLDAFHALGAASSATLVVGGAFAVTGIALFATTPRAGTTVGMAGRF